MNLYEYVKSCPLIYNDPLGMIRLSLPRIGGSWNLQGTKCNLTGSLDFSYDVEEDLWLLYRKISVQVSANFTLANETRKNCKTEYRSTKLTIDDPIYSLEYPPRISVRASLSSSTTTGALSYTIGGSGDAWYNYEVSRTLGLSVDVGNIKKWIGRCCKCLIGSGSMTVSMSARDKVGSEAAVVGLVAIVAAAPESIPYFLYKAEAALKAVILSAPAF
jgi:hypothetical protein